VTEATAPREGELPGWMVPLLRSPELMTRTKALGDYLVRSKTALSGKLTELVILIVARNGHSSIYGSSTNQRRSALA
jgi:hypothetical protein